MMTNGILLGYEVVSGEPVYFPLHHAGFTGMTGKAGKSTGIDGAGRRSEYRVIAFLTKRGEQAFRNAKQIPLYFKEQSDWQYVESLLEAELREDKRFERAWIIKVCRGTKGKLRAVWDNVKDAKKKARKDSLSERVYICLDAYFEIIIPELEKHDFSKTLQLGTEPDVYVMNLIGMSESTQAVVIRSALEYIHKHEKRVICTVPEAWKFVGLKGTPVIDVAERIIKQGFAVKTFLWVDSQDIASINPKIRGQIDNWVLGRQRYEHEINRTLGFIPVKNKPTTEQIQTLKLGHFFVACEEWVKHVYVLPNGVPEEIGIAVAKGIIPPEIVRDHLLAKQLDPELVMSTLKDVEAERDALREERDILKQANETFQQAEKDMHRIIEEHVAERTKDLQDQVDGLTSTLKGTNADYTELAHKHEVFQENARNTIEQQRRELETFKPLADALRGLVDNAMKPHVKAIKGYVQQKLQDTMDLVDGHVKDMLAHPDIHGIDIKVSKPTTTLTVEKPVQPLTLSHEDLTGRIAIVYAEDLLPKKAFTLRALNKIMVQRFGRKEAYPNFKKVLQTFVVWGFFKVVQSGSRQDYQVVMTPKDAKKKGLLIVKDVKT